METDQINCPCGQELDLGVLVVKEIAYCSWNCIPAEICEGRELIRVYPEKGKGKRYLACADCGTNLTDPNDFFADWTGAFSDPHEIVTV